MPEVHPSSHWPTRPAGLGALTKGLLDLLAKTLVSDRVAAMCRDSYLAQQPGVQMDCEQFPIRSESYRFLETQRKILTARR